MPKPLTEEELQKIREWASRLPKEPRSDWEGTNHYEITEDAEGEEHWWMLLGALLHEEDFGNPHISETQTGKRIGLIMDLACAVPKLLATLEAERKRGFQEGASAALDKFYRPSIIS